MADPCAKCEPSHRICRPCAIKARLRAAKLERLIVASYHNDLFAVGKLYTEAARIAKRKAGK